MGKNNKNSIATPAAAVSTGIKNEKGLLSGSISKSDVSSTVADPVKRKKNVVLRGSGVVASKPDITLSDGTVLKEWQRLPKTVLQEWCQKQKRARPQYHRCNSNSTSKNKTKRKEKYDDCLDADGNFVYNSPNLSDASNVDETFRYSCNVPDPKKQELDMKFTCKECFPTESEAQNYAALLALQFLLPTLPLDKKFPEPYNKSWAAFQVAQSGKSVSTPKSLIMGGDKQLASMHSSVSSQTLEHTLPSLDPVEPEELAKPVVVTASNKFVSEKDARLHREEILLKDAERRRKRELKKRKEQRCMPAIVMTENVRRLIEIALGLHSTTEGYKSTAGSNEIQSEVSSSYFSDERLNMRDKLLNMGFLLKDINSVLASESIKSLEDSLDWLCLHVPESLLPKSFDARGKQVDVIVGGIVNAKFKSNLCDGCKAVQNINFQGTQEVDWGVPRYPSAKNDFLSFGFTYDEISCFELLRNDSIKLKLLCEVDIGRNAETINENFEYIASVEEEKMTLEAIYSEDFSYEFKNDVYHIFRTRLSSLLVVDEECDALMDLIIPHNCRYPDDFCDIICCFILKFRSRRCACKISKQICRKLNEQVRCIIENGDNMGGIFFNLISWLQANISTEVSNFIYTKPVQISKKKPSPESITHVASVSNLPRPQQHHQKIIKNQLQNPAYSIYSWLYITGDEALDQKLLDDLNVRNNSMDRQFVTMRETRQKLPAYHYRNDIIIAIQSSSVVLIAGDTGCGKTTQVPQYILDDCIAKSSGSRCGIVCTQPRRLAALGVAERVAAERKSCISSNDKSVISNGVVGGDVGYSIRLETKKSRSTRLLFVTTGVLLRRMQNDPNLNDIKYLIIDEVHERDLNTDFLLLLIKNLIRIRPSLKVILMSATIQTELFRNYFSNCPVIEIPGRTFPVVDIYLEDFESMLNPSKPDITTLDNSELSDEDDILETPDDDKNAKDSSSDDESVLLPISTPKFSKNLNFFPNRIDYIKMEVVLWHIVNKSDCDGAVLIFLPGAGEIKEAFDRISESAQNQKNPIIILQLHGGLGTDDQRKVFVRPPTGVRKIILSTNISETSITIEDVVYVIDAGMHKEMRFDPVNGMSSLVSSWISQANSKQRRGRAGRVRNGYCYYLYTKTKAVELSQYNTPEIQRVPIEQLCLQVKTLCESIENTNSTNTTNSDVYSFLSNAITPPTSTSIKHALNLLTDIGALSENGNITPLGRYLVFLPMDVKVGKMLIWAAMFQCVDPILTIAACLSSKSPLISPIDKRSEANAAHSRFRVSHSDHLTLLNVYNTWSCCNESDWSFCRANFLSAVTLRTIRDIRGQYYDALTSLGFMNLNRNSGSMELVRSIVAAGLYPNIIRIDFPDTKFQQGISGTIETEVDCRQLKLHTKDDGRVFFHPGSCCFGVGDFESPWLAYREKVLTSKVYVRDSTMIGPYALLLLCGSISVDHENGIVMCDNWVRFRGAARIGVLVKALRTRLDDILLQLIHNGGMSINEVETSNVIAAAVKLVSGRGS